VFGGGGFDEKRVGITSSILILNKVRQLKLTMFVVRVESLSDIADSLSDTDRFLNITFQELLARC
jgi:hypothetical protein